MKDEGLCKLAVQINDTHDSSISVETRMQQAAIGLIGGSGLYQMAGLEDVQEHLVDTPFGRPSDVLVTGRLAGVPVVFLARHGRGHRLIPTEVPYRANIHALKQFGVRYLLSFSAVGSLKEELAPLDMVLPDQFIDMTRRRENTFFGQGVVAHVSMAQPVCAQVSDALARAVAEVAAQDPVTLHRGGTYVCIEGPQFSSLAESHWYRSMGASIIGMTNMPEARLAREAQIAYATLAMVTDYDCWHPHEAHVSADMAIANLMKNAARAQQVAARAVALLAHERPVSEAHTALAAALITPRETWSTEAQARLGVLLT
jgi:5'-methylthioadenosine phosphorylase